MEPTIRILHLEDNAHDGEIVNALLEEEGIAFEIERAGTRAEYEKALQTGQFDLILCDYNLPSFNGEAALEMAQKASKDVPFIFVSGTIGEERAIEALLKGATDYVLKDRMKRLIPAIRRAVKEKEALRTHRQLEDQLFQSQKLESIGMLAGGVAHDFNNILGIIMGHAGLLERGRHDPKILSGSIDAIMKATERGALLVRQLLTIAKKGEASPQFLDVSKEVQNFVNFLRGTFPKSIEIAISMDEGLPHIFIDPTQLQQVLLNLSVNSKDAMPDGGILALTSRLVSRSDLQLTFPDVVYDRYVLLEVSDTGSGMDSETRKRMFEPFYTTKENGTGLGLATTFGIVRKHEGLIDVVSEIGKGTRSLLYFPVKQTDELNQQSP